MREKRRLDLAQTPAEPAPPPPRFDPDTYGAACSVVDGCLTCGDVAVPVTVVIPGDADAVCRDPHGNEGKVAVDLVAPVAEGDRLLVHAGVAIERL